MFANFWAFIKLLNELVNAIKVFLGLVERAKHEGAIKEIDTNAGQAGNPDLSDEEREDAAKKLEDIANGRT